MAFQSLRNAGIERTLRVTSCAGAAGVGRLAGMNEVYRACQTGLKEDFGEKFAGLNQLLSRINP
jgi:hypothetical protein